MTSKQSRVCTQLICCIIGSAVVSPAYAQSEGFLRKQLQDYGYPVRTQEDIVRALEAPRPIVRSIAIMLVRETKHVDAIPKLVAALGDEDINVRIDAARTLTVLGDDRGRTVLKSIVSRQLPDKPPGEKTVSEVIGSCKEFWTVLDAVLGLVESGDKTYIWAAEWASVNARLPIERSRAVRIVAAVADRPKTLGADVAQRSLDILLQVARTERDPGVLLEVILQAKRANDKAIGETLLRTISVSSNAPAASRWHAAAARSKVEGSTLQQPTSSPAPNSARKSD